MTQKDGQVPELIFTEVGLDEEGGTYIASHASESGQLVTSITRLWSYKNGTWLYRDVEAEVSAILRTIKPHPAGYALGKDGTFSIATKDGITVETIVDAGVGSGKYGYLHGLKLIEGELYACGHRGQVYKRTSEGWVHIDAGLLQTIGAAPDNLVLYDIDGFSGEDVYAVGLNGIVCHYDGKTWKSQTIGQEHLERVLCVSSARVFICGGNEEVGVLYEGGITSGWKSYRINATGGFWGLCMFRNEIYVCSQKQLFKLQEEHLVEVKLTVTPEPWFHRLVANDNILWSVGHEDLLTFDGLTWQRIVNLDV